MQQAGEVFDPFCPGVRTIVAAEPCAGKWRVRAGWFDFCICRKCPTYQGYLANWFWGHVVEYGSIQGGVPGIAIGWLQRY